jgi:hypothetical protein
MPWADPEKNAEAVRRWRARNPGYWRRSNRARDEPPISRYQALSEDLTQQGELFRLSRRKADDPQAYRLRERRWIAATAFWSSDVDEPERRDRTDD